MSSLRLAIVLAAGATPLPGAASREQPIVLPLDDLPLWFRWIGGPCQGLDGVHKGEPLDDGSMAGVPLAVDGYPGVFTITREGGEPVLRVSSKLYAALTSKARYGDYHLRSPYRWGEKPFPTRTPDKLRDSGIQIHLTGGLDDAHWSLPLMGLEGQVSERRTVNPQVVSDEDYLLQPDVEAHTADRLRWTSKAQWRRIGGAGANPILKHAVAFQSRHVQWSTVDIYTVGDMVYRCRVTRAL